MSAIDETSSGRYRLSGYLIAVMNESVTAEEYVHYRDENIIRRISYPAIIDPREQSLIIRTSIMHGEDTRLTADQLSETVSHLPQWDLTKYYQIFDGERHETHQCNSNLLLKRQRLLFTSGNAPCYTQVK